MIVAMVCVGIGVPCLWWLSRQLALWLFDHVCLGRAAPWVFAWAIWSWPRPLKPKMEQAAVQPKKGGDRGNQG